MDTNLSKIQTKQEEIDFNLAKAKHIWAGLESKVIDLWQMTVCKEDASPLLKMIVKNIEMTKCVLADYLFAAQEANDELGEILADNRKQVAITERKAA
jgi:hypothetical protein